MEANKVWFSKEVSIPFPADTDDIWLEFAPTEATALEQSAVRRIDAVMKKQGDCGELRVVVISQNNPRRVKATAMMSGDTKTVATFERAVKQYVLDVLTYALTLLRLRKGARGATKATGRQAG